MVKIPVDSINELKHDFARIRQFYSKMIVEVKILHDSIKEFDDKLEKIIEDMEE